MKTILVIEDEQAVRQTIKTTLEEQGFQVVDAADGLAGIEMLTTHHPDLVVCGIVIPECDGYAVLDALRHNDTTTGIPFIFLSSKSDKSDIRHGMNLGADDYLTKPFTDEDLLSAINARLDRQEAIAVPYQRDMKRAVDSLNQVAFYDPVTRLPNLIFLHQLLQEQLDRVQNQGISSDNWAIAVLNIHLSHQDWVARRNKLPLSEPLLRAVSARLKTTAEQNRAPFNGLVARVGSHQFALVLYNNDAARDLNELLNQLIADLEAPYEIEQYPVNIIAKIGGARFPQDGITSSTLLHRADIAVHHCVKSDDSVHQCYAQDMEAGYYRHKRLLGEIQSALDRGEFSLLYQPQLNTISERVTGAEALLRWQHPEFGQIAYEEFITIAEEARLLPKLGRWVVQTGCEQLREWRPLTLIPLQLSINIWQQQLQDSAFVEHLLEAVRQADLNPKQLVLDIGEPSFVAFDHDGIAPILHEITATGIQIAVDEFGMRGMPLQYLKTLPIHIIKPGRDLVEGITRNEEDALMTEMIIELAQRLKLKAHAKGVTTNQHVDVLMKYGCHTMQGYHYSEPVLSEDFKVILSGGLQQ